MNRKVGEGGGCTNAHPHKTNEGGKGRGSQTTSIPHTSNIIIHDSAAVTVFGTVHSSQANLNHFITVLASSGSIIDHWVMRKSLTSLFCSDMISYSCILRHVVSARCFKTFCGLRLICQVDLYYKSTQIEEAVYGQKTLFSYTNIESTCFRKTPRHRVNKFVAGLFEEEVM